MKAFRHITARATAVLLLAMLLPLWGVGSLVWADPVTPEQALQLARSFIQQREAASRQSHHAPGAATGTNAGDDGQAPALIMAKEVSGLYVFNVADNGGFVIVSNDDRTKPILGFGESGNIDPDNMPSNMRAWLQGYADEIAWLQKNKIIIVNEGMIKAPRLVGSHSTTAIAPMVTTTWNQNTPYNNQTPYYKKDSNGNYSYSSTAQNDYSHCATGCVATAMAQVMNYHQWPQTATNQPATNTIPGYSWKGIDLYSLPATTFDWANMKDSYTTNSYSTTQATAVAKLMQYCGWSVQMDYGEESGANASKVATALQDYFDYKTTAKHVTRKLYTEANWTDLIYFELAHGRPVVYGGQSTSGGHAFVCDGYKYESGTDFFHINWGWGGLSDNYFTLSALNPDRQGIGGSSSNDGFNYDQEAVIGIQRSTDDGEMSDIQPKKIDLTLNSTTLSSDEVTVNTEVYVTFNVTNNSQDDFENTICLGRLSEGSHSILKGSTFTIPAGQTADCVIPFTPTETGTYDFEYWWPLTTGGYMTDCIIRATLTVLPSGAPTDLAVSDIKGHSAVLSWTDNNNASSWVVAYAAEGATSYSQVSAPTNPFTLTGLAGETKYTVKVRPANETDSWSQEITFTTDEACAAPQELAVSNITHDAAMTTWTGYADSYEVRYGTVPEDFISISASWLQYDNGSINSLFGYNDLEEYTWGVMYPGSQVTGNLLTKVSIFEAYGYNTETITVNIYSGGDNAPGTLLYTQEVTPEALNAFHEVTLDQPVSITRGENLWITLTEKGQFTICYSEITDADPNSQWLMYNGNWYQARNMFSNTDIQSRSWMIRGYMESEGINPDLVTWTTAPVNDYSFQLTGLEPATDYVVQVRGNYDGEGSSQWETAMFTTLPEVILADGAATNSETLAQYADGQEVCVTLADRTLYKDGEWNTICLPFDVTLSDSPLAGATAKTLTDATMTGTTVSLTFGAPVDKLKAGVPYIIKWSSAEGTTPATVTEDIVSPTFTGVTIDATAEQTIEKADGHVKFIGYYDAFDITAANDDIYYMTAGSTLKHTAKDRTLLACRAYFQFSENVVSSARQFVLDFGEGATTSIADNMSETTTTSHSVYDLQGRRMVNGQSSMVNGQLRKGLYIKDGRKVVVK